MSAYEWEGLKFFLDSKVEQYNQPEFIENDPIVIPHGYTKKEDIEITAFWAATLAWGQRVTIIRKCTKLFEMMDNDPHQFILHHTDADLKPFLKFKHRTFNDLDTLYFISSLQRVYQELGSLELAFSQGMNKERRGCQQALVHFHEYFFTMEEAPYRTRKHVATPKRKSACKEVKYVLKMDGSSR